jgi:hypothetical protein
MVAPVTAPWVRRLPVEMPAPEADHEGDQLLPFHVSHSMPAPWELVELRTQKRLCEWPVDPFQVPMSVSHQESLNCSPANRPEEPGLLPMPAGFAAITVW